MVALTGWCASEMHTQVVQVTDVSPASCLPSTYTERFLAKAERFGGVMKLLGMKGFAGMVGATLAAVVMSASSPNVAVMVTQNASSSVVPKTVFSSKVRVVLAVGLEGTGHGYFLHVREDLFKKNRHLARLSDIAVSRYRIWISMGSSVKQYSIAYQQARTEMRKLAHRGAGLSFPGTVKIIHGKQSYPFGYGPNKVLKYMDLRMLAEVAEAEGVDFRVVYLRRPVKDILVANTVHRRFQE